MPKYRIKSDDMIYIKSVIPDNFHQFKLKTGFIFSEFIEDCLNIPKMIPTDSDDNINKKEIWTFAIFDRTKVHRKFSKERRYLISTFGRVYDLHKSRLVSISDSSGYFCTANNERYKKANIAIYDTYTNYYIHRLMASSFICKPNKYYNIVNHKDEHPYNNYIWNLEWVDKSGNANLHNMWVKSQETSSVPTNTTWSIDEIKEICYMIADGHKATYIYNALHEKYPNDKKIEYERIRTMYKHIMKRGDFHEIALSCGVIFDNEPNYLKEKGSVNKIAELKNKIPGEYKSL